MNSNILTPIEMLKPMLLIFLAISCNYLANILPCSFQYFLDNSMISRHICIFLLIYLTIDFTKYFHDNKNIIHPIYLFFNTFIIYILYILFSKQSLFYILILLFLLIVFFVNDNIIEYYNKNNKNNENNENNENNKNNALSTNYYLKKYLPYLIFIILIIGFISYFLKQYKDYGKNFSIIKFIFGVKICNSFKTFKKIDIDNINLVSKKKFNNYFNNKN